MSQQLDLTQQDKVKAQCYIKNNFGYDIDDLEKDITTKAITVMNVAPLSNSN